MQKYVITESCGCMSVDEMNEEYKDEWNNCPYCGKQLGLALNWKGKSVRI